MNTRTTFRWLFRATQALSSAILRVAAIGLMLMTIITGWQIAGRYLFNASPEWTEALSLVLMLYYVLLAAAVGVREGFHLGLSIVADNLPGGLRKGNACVAITLVGAFGLMMLYYGLGLVSYTEGHRIPTLGIARSVAYWPFVIAGGLIVLFVLERIVLIVCDGPGGSK